MKKITLQILCLLFVAFSYGQTYTSGLFDVENPGMSGVRIISAQIDVNATTSVVTITLIGDDDEWIALGLDTDSMTAGKDVLFFGEGGSGPIVTDRNFVGIGSEPNIDAQQDWTVVSNNTSGGDRTIVVTRPLNTGDANDYIFPSLPTVMDVVGAHGDAASSGEPTDFDAGYHGFFNKSTREITFALLNTNEVNDIKFSMTPNPASTNLNIVLPSHLQKAKVQVYDVLGKQIYSGIMSSHVSKINVSNWNSGVYLVKVSNDRSTQTKRFVKQ